MRSISKGQNAKQKPLDKAKPESRKERKKKNQLGALERDIYADTGGLAGGRWWG